MSDFEKTINQLLGIDPNAAAEKLLELARLRSKAKRVDELEDSLERVKRKAQFLLDTAYNLALHDMVNGETSGEAWARANRLRRVVRHATEFGKKG